MTAYFIMIGVPFTLAVLFNSLKGYRIKNKDKIILDIFFGIWLILLVFRNNRLGVDLPVYKYHFVNFSAMTWPEILKGIATRDFEASFSILAKTISMFSMNFQWVIAACAVISVIPIWLLYRTHAKYGYLMLVLFVNIAPFAMYFSGLRQIIAMAFVVPCYYFCKNKKILLFLMMVALAFFAHNSAIILLVMYPIYHARLKNKLHLLYIIPGIILIQKYSLPIFTGLLRFAGENYWNEYSAGIKSTGAYAVLLLLIVILIYSYVMIDKEKLDDETIGLRNLLLLCILIQIFAGVHSLSMRMNYYYLLFVPLLIPRIIDRAKKNYNIWIILSVICMVIFFTIYYFYRAYTESDILGIYPYISMFADN